MIPYIKTIYGDISVFTLLILIATLTMLFSIHISLKKAINRTEEELFIIPKVITCGVFGLSFAALFDSLFKFIEYRTFKVSGITFYGGLIGAIITLYIQLKISGKNTQFKIGQWFELLTMPLIIFHSFGRIGCFFAGCCYGKPTNSFLGVTFPDNIEHEIIHNGVKCFPTQLFESVALVIIFILVKFAKKKFQTYLFFYSIARFCLEYLRGDDRGCLIDKLSPAQCISIIIIIILLIYNFVIILKDNNKVKLNY